MSWVDKLNILLAIVGAGAAFGACNRMSRETPCEIIVAFVTSGTGLIGFALAPLLSAGVQSACDTLLIGGVAALIIGTRRQTVWVRPQVMPYLSCIVSGATWVAFFVGVE
jgi:hypothetical protein